MRKLKRRLILQAYQSVFSRRIRIETDRPVFTFTFDDVPVSAATRGVPILEKVGASATFYISGDLAIRSEQTRGSWPLPQKYIPLPLVKELHASGHHIACHTYTHYDLHKGNASEFAEDAGRNRALLSELLGESRIEHFSFPEGHASLRAKRILREHYTTLRSIEPGVNFGNVDAMFLKAINIYSANLDRQRIQSWIDRSAEVRGWTIFYTHDVDESPTPWGTTPDDLTWVAKQCLAAGGELLNIDQAHKMLSGEGGVNREVAVT